MSAVAESILTSSLDQAARGLDAVLSGSEEQIGVLTEAFQELAREAASVLDLAGLIVGCAEADRVLSVLPGVQALAAEARRFLHERLEATSGILETVTAEAALLSRLSRLTRGQKAIVRETEMLRVLTNIEVARLGEAGAGFQYLAHELDDFSQTVSQSIGELSRSTDERKAAIEATRHSLLGELPRTREEAARTDSGFDEAQALVESALTRLHEVPARLKACIEEIAGQIAGVVAAVQANDITRQQIEHVRDALFLIGERLQAGSGPDLPLLRAGLAIQTYQLRSIGQTVQGWTSQIRNCLGALARIASSEVLEIAPLVLEQAQKLSGQLERMQRLEQACQASNDRVRDSAAAVSELMHLVSRHLESTRSVRDRLQLLMFNSIVEASHLGTRADGILEISRSIKRISAAWSEMTGHSEEARQEIEALVEHSSQALCIFSDAASGALREAQEQTRSGEETLREAAGCAASHGAHIQEAIARLQSHISAIGDTSDRLDDCFRRIDATRGQVESLEPQLGPALRPADCDMGEIERLFAASYTTEAEREILRAAVAGAALPETAQSFAGNDVELF